MKKLTSATLASKYGKVSDCRSGNGSSQHDSRLKSRYTYLWLTLQSSGTKDKRWCSGKVMQVFLMIGKFDLKVFYISTFELIAMFFPNDLRG